MPRSLRSCLVDGTTNAPRGTSQLLPAEQLIVLQAAHASLVNAPASADTHHAFQDALTRTIVTIVDKLYPTLDEAIDSASVAYRLRHARGAHGGISRTDAFDFYRTSNPSEIGRVVPIMRAFIVRLDQLIEDWPEQIVLAHIRERCEAVLALPAIAVLPRPLAHLENLLGPMDDWQALASREVSLDAHRTQIIDLIVDWRRLELASWPPLLDYESRRFVEEVAEWWPRFYETTIWGPQAFIAAAESIEGDAYLRELVSLLDSFFTSSPVGQFRARLRLAQSFASHAAVLVVSARDSHILRHVARILNNVCNYYDRFLAPVTAFIAGERAKVEKSVRDVVKLASWKDVNVHALRQSAQRSHRQLHKCIKTWRAVLQRGAANFFVDVSPSISTTAKIAPSAAHSIDNVYITDALGQASAPDAAVSLQQLPRTLARFEYVLEASKEPEHASAVDSLTRNIASTAEALGKEAVPEGETRDRLFKALLTRKRRAWADLLKEMRRIGLSPNPNTAVVARLRDSSVVYREGREVSRAPLLVNDRAEPFPVFV
jgi:midasin